MFSSSPRQPSVSVYFVIAEDFKWRGEGPLTQIQRDVHPRSSLQVLNRAVFEKIGLMRTR